ncbi:Asp/Glu/hydantoin racemase [Paracidovorax wautersii]|uniref:maleate cis-trans isomerase family protein n=1 Tax=Paracidovorax wautersii TaxID=1177982 RepID=UPI0031E07200
MEPRTLIGMLTPSSNTVLEPVTAAMLHGLPQVSAHFGRFKVTEIALSAQANAQFGNRGMLNAAELLSHARCSVIGWNGTSAGWLGFDTDQALCAAIEAASGARACTSVLALNEVLQRTGVRRLGLVSPYLPEVQQAIVRNYAALGITCVAERHLGIQDNFAFSEVDADTLRKCVHDVMTSGGERPEAIAIYCTNLRGAPLAAELETQWGVPVYDSVATVLWKALQLAGVNASALAPRWGSVFDLR